MSGHVEYRVYLGAYTEAASAAHGIGLALADDTGELHGTDRVAGTPDPSFLASAPDGSALYAVNELSAGRITAFSIRDDGSLQEINSQPSWGEAPCHVSVHPSGRFVFTANYVSGNVVVHPIGEGGALREACHVVQHSGSGPDPDRQRGPHAHQIVPDVGGRHVLAVDLGTDSIHVYDFDVDSGHLAVGRETALPPGSGPRHLAFTPSGDRLYLISELASTITEFDYDADTGSLRPGKTLSTLPEGYDGPNLASEVLVSADGRYVYGSNRGHDSIAVFESGAVDGEFRLVGVHPAGVSEPRHISLGLDGRTLFAAGQDSGTVRTFPIGASGEPGPASEPLVMSNPACVLPMAVTR